MQDMSVHGTAGGAAQQGWPQPSESAEEPLQPVQNGGEDSSLQSMLDQGREEAESLTEMIKDAQEKAKAQREALKLPKNNIRYGDAPLEAYARLARARDKAAVNAASGYARRRLAQFKTALHTDSDNAAKIKAAINQLQKAINRGEKKKRELDREKLTERQKAASREAKERLKQELRRRRAQRMIREQGYLREADVSNRLAAQLTATQMELRQQAQELAAATAASAEAAAQQYTAVSASAAAPAPVDPSLSLQG